MWNAWIRCFQYRLNCRISYHPSLYNLLWRPSRGSRYTKACLAVQNSISSTSDSMRRKGRSLWCARRARTKKKSNQSLITFTRELATGKSQWNQRGNVICQKVNAYSSITKKIIYFSQYSPFALRTSRIRASTTVLLVKYVDIQRI